MPELLIMNCPYCGSSDVHELDRGVGHALEAVLVCCLSCDETCTVERYLGTDDQIEELFTPVDTDDTCPICGSAECEHAAKLDP